MTDPTSNTTARDILLVDDSSDFCHLLGMFLRSRGYEVTTTSTAETALHICDCYKFKMIITDYNMPEINGIELARSIKKKHRDVVILMITGNVIEDIVEDAVRAGVAEIFPKPINLLKLGQSVTASLRAWHSTAA